MKRPCKEEHLKHLRLVLELLLKEQFHINREKCQFCMRSINLQGHVLSADGVKPNPDKLRIMHEWPVPTAAGGKKELQKFLGLANFFRKFAFRYTETVRPLQQLIPAHVPWEWGPEQDAAWHAVKRLLTEQAVLATPNSRDPFHVVVDASDYAIGGILFQNDKVVAHEGRKLKPPELNYGVGEKEFLAAHYCHT